eukprot:CAMPEP_0116919742 /NCGR_PEP_ID=MMETSP0467-20121206/20580_1 /TAXON_ID=283647 /ORGANISM="Mesodinium pulex, Strain SPMC105" /LENGTH=114 /DNA_ID=CAMNT_0004597405 /DNA_START=1007 /DNA_END=1351 /DNA_ORIENTATION=+
MRKYEVNIEQVDPQLKNNAELVECVQNFETAWEKGRTYLSTARDVQNLTAFCNLIEHLKQRYRSFLNDIECMDVSVFLQVPNILIFYSLENRDFDLCNSLFTPLTDNDHPIAQK